MTVFAASGEAFAVVDASSGDDISRDVSLGRSPRVSIVEVSIILINWRSKDYVRACLESIAQERQRDSYEVLVVDNDSGDGCGTMLEEQFPHVRYIESETNLGFARANNLAAAESRGRYILFLNPDTEVFPGAIGTLAAALDAHPEAGMVGARLLNTDRTLQTTCVTAVPNILNQTLNLGWLRATFPMWGIWGMRALYRAGKTPSAVEAISGACMMVRREVVEQVEGFSSDYFMYAEDMDLCAKVAKAGHAILYVPEAIIVHHGGASSSQREESHFSSIATREALMRFFTLHRGRGYAWTCRAFIALVCTLRLSALARASPVVLHPRGARFLRRAWAKWGSILAWCIGWPALRQQAVNG
jgi:N-acetylglucosaminyl-diphospho-decaprenol L-rhamnosyltransferase